MDASRTTHATTAAAHAQEAAHAFPLLGFLFALGALVSGHWLVSVVNEWLEHTRVFAEAPVAIALLLLALTVLLAWWLRRIHHANPHSKGADQFVPMFLLGVLVFVSAAALAHVGEQLVREGWPQMVPAVFFWVALAILIVFGIGFDHARSSFARPRNYEPPPSVQLRERVGPDSRTRMLILFVSTPGIVPEVHDAPGARCHATLTDKTGDSYELPGRSLTEDIGRIPAELRWPWQQLMRAIEPHQYLRRVVLIGSRAVDGGDGSGQHLPICARFLRPYLRPGTEVVCAGDSPSFEDFDELVAAVRTTLHSQQGSFSTEQVQLDITGGQKVTSIAGATLTLGNQLRFQYVQTGGQKKVIFYDLVSDEIPRPEL